MNAHDLDLLYRAANQEFDKGEELMLVTPLAIIGLVDDLRRSERLRHEAGRYDLVSEPAEPG